MKFNHSFITIFLFAGVALLIHCYSFFIENTCYRYACISSNILFSIVCYFFLKCDIMAKDLHEDYVTAIKEYRENYMQSKK